MRSLSSDTLAALAGSEVYMAQLVLLDFAGGAVALNTSTWDLDFDGVTYKGAFGLGKISSIEDSPGEIKGLTLELSGVSSSAISLALDAADIVQGTPVVIRTALLNSSYQVVDAPIEWSGLLDTMTLSEDASQASISVSAESSAVDLLHGSPSTYSDATQQLLYSGDKAFEYIVSQSDQPVVWPSKEWFMK